MCDNPEWDAIPDPDFFKRDDDVPDINDPDGYEPVPGEEHWDD